MNEVKAIIAFMNESGLGQFETDEDLAGGIAYDTHGAAISDAAMEKALAADAVLFGAVGDWKYDQLERALEAIQGAARTGRIGDGKIFISDIQEVIRIRTGERGEDAV